MAENDNINEKEINDAHKRAAQNAFRNTFPAGQRQPKLDRLGIDPTPSIQPRPKVEVPPPFEQNKNTEKPPESPLKPTQDLPFKFNQTSVEIDNRGDPRPFWPEDLLEDPFVLQYVKKVTNGITEESVKIRFGVAIDPRTKVENPVVKVPLKFIGSSFGDLIKLDWVGKVWLQWLYDENGVGDVDIVGPAEPALVPYDPNVALESGKTTGYYIRIGEATKDGVVQDFTGNFFIPDGLPKGIANGELLYWDNTDQKWKLTEAPTQGAIAYWDATLEPPTWVMLPAPSPSGLYVLTHDGTVPSWTATSECP